MRILLLTGVQEELALILADHPFEFDRELRAYRSTVVPDLWARTTGPGVSQAREVRRLAMEIIPQIVVNAGLVGLLREEDPYEAGDRIPIKTVYDDLTTTIYPGGPGRHSLVTVPAPVFEPSDKMDLYLKHHATVCDMEAARLLFLFGQLEEVSGRTALVFCKVVGDRPAMYDLFRHEHLVRAWHRRSIWERALAGLRFPGGPLQLSRLLKTKSLGLQGLKEATENLLLRLVTMKPDQKPDVDSIFLPH